MFREEIGITNQIIKWKLQVEITKMSNIQYQKTLMCVGEDLCVGE